MSRRPTTASTVCACLLTLSISSCAAVTYDTHDDATVSTQVKIALIEDARLGEFRINARTSHGVVTLQGTVPSQADIDEAMAVARRVRGVREVKSELKIVGGWLPAPAWQLPFPVPGPVTSSRF